eukprot:gene25531-1700_t
MYRLILYSALLSLLIHLPLADPQKTLISIASDKDNADEIKLLIDQGADVNELTAIGESVLHLVCIWGGAEKAELLLAAGADPNYRATKVPSSLDMTPLTWCAYAGYTDTIAEFLKDGRTEVNLIVKQEDGQCITATDIAIKIAGARGMSTQDLLMEGGGLTYNQLKESDLTRGLLPPSGCP